MLCGATLHRVGEVFERELEAGLRDQPSSLQMANTYVPELPDGTGTNYSQSSNCTSLLYVTGHYGHFAMSSFGEPSR